MAKQTVKKKASIKNGKRGKNAGNKIPEGRRFLPGNKAAVGHGRPKKIYASFPGYTPSQINETYLALLQLPEKELENIHKTKSSEYTALEIWVASAIRKGIASGQIRDIDTLLNRTFGYPKSEVDHNLKTEQPLFPDVK